MSVGQNIKRAREGANMTQEELAAKMGIAQYALCRMEIGTKCLPFERAVQLSEILNVPLDYFKE